MVPFPWGRFLERARAPERGRGAAAISPAWWAAKLALHFGLAPLLARTSHALVDLARRSRPDVVFIYRGLLVPPRVLAALRQAAPRAIIVGYNNDDPFAPANPAWLWRHFLAALPHYDLALAFRALNLAEFRAAGAPRVDLLRAWFVPWIHRPLALDPADRERFDCDVAFIGHYEADGRLDLLEAVMQAGYRLRLFGANWHRAPPRAWLGRLAPIHPVFGDDYAKAVRGAKVALAFLSRRNRDSYTTRSFEIPACGGFMLSPFTPDLAALFREGREAEFFRSRDEMIAKIGCYRDDAEARTRIAQAGRARVFTDGHDVMSRAAALIDRFAPLVAGRRLPGRS
ncbi:MAG: glycosyltransferase, partial [Aquamicrobium sp.]|nr:glycosyltransferase [Aquamicrobium sp.]